MYTLTVSQSSKVTASYLESVKVRMHNAPTDLDLVLSSVTRCNRIVHCAHVLWTSRCINKIIVSFAFKLILPCYFEDVCHLML